MALRGSLSEFELPDIFQLIANDGKTGQLVLYDKDNEAFVIFLRGSIVSAGDRFLNLQTVLFKYLSSCKHFSGEELNELLYLCQGEMKLFTQELVSKGYLTKEELTAISTMSIEDLTCSLFFWENGRYRFDSLDSIDDYTAGGVTLSSDAVTMEAMRRIDEWKRMTSSADNTTVFFQVRSTGAAQQPPPNPFMDPSGFILNLIDGVSSVGDLCSRLFFTEYRIYETLFGLWQSNKIMPLQSAPVDRSAAAESQELKQPLVLHPTIKSIAVAHCIMVILWGFGLLVNHGHFSKEGRERQSLEYAQKAAYANNKIRAAVLHFRSSMGVLPANIRELQEAGLILPNDVSNYPLKVQNFIIPADTIGGTK